MLIMFGQMYRVCAPDGFIPNSVVREKYGAVKDGLPPVDVKDEAEIWVPVWREEWGEMNTTLQCVKQNDKGKKHF